MPQSYRKRFEGHELEIASDMKAMGMGPSAEKWGAADYICWENYKKELVGNETIPYLSKPLTQSVSAGGREFWTTLFDFVDALKNENQRLYSENDELKKRGYEQEMQIKLRFSQLTETLGRFTKEARL